MEAMEGDLGVLVCSYCLALSTDTARLGSWDECPTTSVPFLVLRHLLPPGAFALVFSLACQFFFSPLSPPPSQDPSVHLTDLWASLPTARRPGGPQDPPFQGEGLQEGETLWHLPSGHHSGGLRLQRCVADGIQGMLLSLDPSNWGGWGHC